MVLRFRSDYTTLTTICTKQNFFLKICICRKKLEKSLKELLLQNLVKNVAKNRVLSMSVPVFSSMSIGRLVASTSGFLSALWALTLNMWVLLIHNFGKKTKLGHIPFFDLSCFRSFYGWFYFQKFNQYCTNQKSFYPFSEKNSKFLVFSLNYCFSSKIQKKLFLPFH